MVSGPANRRARWHEFFSLFDLHVSYLPGKHTTVADALSRRAYPATEGLQSTNMRGTEQDRHVVIEWNREERKLMRRECVQCSVKRHSVPCHDITAFSDPAHAHEIVTKSLNVVVNVMDPSSESVKRTKHTPPVSGFWLIQGGQRRNPAMFLRLAAINHPGVSRGRFVGVHQSGVPGCKPPPRFLPGASSCTVTGATPQPSVPTYLPPDPAKLPPLPNNSLIISD